MRRQLYNIKKYKKNKMSGARYCDNVDRNAKTVNV